VTRVTRGIFPTVLLFVMAFALGTQQTARSSATHASASPDSQANAIAPSSAPQATVDPSGVMFFAKDQVSQAAVASGLLYNGNPDHSYRVHIFRRDKPGEVEVHARDTDIFYIIGGSGTFATGGTAVAGKETAPDEIRGSSMNGGLSRTISPGDVLIIPANVPHWFKEIQAPITYFTVKVR
jgi:quercetin dioxygenase-like cupin family protein